MFPPHSKQLWRSIALTCDCSGCVFIVLPRDVHVLQWCPEAFTDGSRRELSFTRARARVRGSVWGPASAGVYSSNIAAPWRFVQRKWQCCAKRVTQMCCERCRNNLFDTAHRRRSVGAPGAPAASSGEPPGPEAPGGAPEPAGVPAPPPAREPDVRRTGSG